MTTIACLLLFVVALPAEAMSLYLLGCTLLSRALPLPPRSSRRLRFDVIVPAHDEAAVIAGTVASLRKIDWPVDRFRIARGMRWKLPSRPVSLRAGRMPSSWWTPTPRCRPTCSRRLLHASRTVRRWCRRAMAC